jgi:hypothetical protein
MSNIEYHYQTIGRVLAHLVDRGLRRVDLDSEDAMVIMTERWGDEEEVVAVFADVLQWMIAERLIRASSVAEYDGGYDFIGVQLTSRGISVIQADLDDAKPGETIERTIAKRGAAGLDAPTYTKIGSFVGGFMGGFTKSMGS